MMLGAICLYGSCILNQYIIQMGREEVHLVQDLCVTLTIHVNTTYSHQRQSYGQVVGMVMFHFQCNTIAHIYGMVSVVSM